MNFASENLADGRPQSERAVDVPVPNVAVPEPAANVPAPDVSLPDYPLPTRRPPERKVAAGGDVTSSLQSLLGTIVIAVFVITFIVQAFQIPSPSMEKTLLIGDYLLVNKLCYGGGGIADYVMPYRAVRRGDIVVFHYPVTPALHFVKRVIGVHGDRIRLDN